MPALEAGLITALNSSTHLVDAATALPTFLRSLKGRPNQKFCSLINWLCERCQEVGITPVIIIARCNQNAIATRCWREGTPCGSNYFTIKLDAPLNLCRERVSTRDGVDSALLVKDRKSGIVPLDFTHGLVSRAKTDYTVEVDGKGIEAVASEVIAIMGERVPTMCVSKTEIVPVYPLNGYSGIFFRRPRKPGNLFLKNVIQPLARILTKDQYKLLDNFYKNKKVTERHITLLFGVRTLASLTQFEAWPKGMRVPLTGSTVYVREDEGGWIVSLKLGDEANAVIRGAIPPNQIGETQTLHITVGCGGKYSPVYSNTLIREGTPVASLTEGELQGELSFVQFS